jgi:sulfur relay (sulfurtransferase) DsrF/TusC family protein
MENLNIILRRPPYGSVDAPEAIRHALGAVNDDMEVRLILLDGGVNSARKGQDVTGTEYLNAEEGIQDCVDMGVKVYVDELSLKNVHLNKDGIVEGVIVSNSIDIAEILKEDCTTMIF